MFVLNINAGKIAAGLEPEESFPEENLDRGVVRTNEDAPACRGRQQHHLTTAEVIRERMGIMRHLPPQDLTTLRFGAPSPSPSPSIHAALLGVWERQDLLDREQQILDDAIALAEIWGEEAKKRD
jgi:hypothetical protein